MEIKNNKFYQNTSIISNKKVLKIKDCDITNNDQYLISGHYQRGQSIYYTITRKGYNYIKNSEKLYLDNVKINNKDSTSIYGGDCSIVNRLLSKLMV